MTIKIAFPDNYCDDASLVEPLPTEIQDLSEYKDAHLKYEDLRKGTRRIPIPPAELVAYANFRPADLVALVNKNPTAKFIRVFNGVRPSGIYTHFMFMVAVDSNENVIDTMVIENCCQCPPRCKDKGGF